LGFKTFGDAMRRGILTLTTVGYGDIVPHTTASRLADEIAALRQSQPWAGAPHTWR
jgi:hypothetical protein